MTDGSVVVRAPNWLGDTVMALPALWALRTGRPAARIAVVGPWAGVLSGQGVADLLVPYPAETGRRGAVDRILAAEPPDLALILPNSLASALAARRWRARRRVGFAADGRDLLLTDPVALPDPRRHQVDEYLLLAEVAGGRGGDLSTRWRRLAHAEAEVEVDRLLHLAGARHAGRGAGGGAPLVGLHLGAAGGATKRWLPERFGELARALVGAKMVPLLLGAPVDVPAAVRAIEAAGIPVPSAVGQDRVELIPYLLARLDCLVSGDTGVAHLAAALGVVTITLFGPTDPARTGARGPRARVVSAGAPCAPCFLRECPIDHVCLRELAATEVARQVLEAVA